MPNQMVHGSLERGLRIIGTLGFSHTLDLLVDVVAVLSSKGPENDEPVSGLTGHHCSE
jgi:hypothetical protein